MRALPRPLLPLLVLAPPALASGTGNLHLAIIRQGPESAGAREENEYTGATVAVGDFNGDGYEDLATASPRDGQQAVFPFAGGVVLNFGSEYGLTHEDARWLGPVGAGVPLDEHAELGYALAAGDFNGDGYDDLAVGAPSWDYLSNSEAGRVCMYFGSPNGPGSGPDYHIFQSNSGGANEAGDRFGFALAAGKLGTDAVYDDLIVGAPGEDGDIGAISWFLGSANGFTGSSSGWIKPSTLGTTGNPGDEFGRAVTVGEVWGSAGWDDVVVGQPLYDDGGLSNSGQVVLIKGSSTGLSHNNAIEYRSGDAGFAPQSLAYFGWSLATGNLYDDADGRVDLVVSQMGGGTGGRVFVAPTAGGSPDFAGGKVLSQSTVGSAVPENSDQFGYSVACGDWDADADDDLAIGVPGEDIGSGASGTLNSGLVHVFLGRPGGPTSAGHEQFREDDLGDELDAFARLGHAVALGEFDATGRANLAAGAPGHDDETGQVYVIAPWRQVMDLPCRNSIAVDCSDNIIYSQKPFDQVYIASTTKIMTVLLACEAAQLPANHPDYVGLNELYTIDPWMTGQFPPTSGCSIYGFFTGEKMSLLNLMRTCLAVSGNDSAVGIGDMLTGSQVTQWNGYTGTTVEFVNRMNARAQQIGMWSTNFTNAPGIDSGDPMSTAYDMYLLSREAMKNPLFANIAGTAQWVINRDLPFVPWPVVDVVPNGFFQNTQNKVATATGIKGGSTPKALRTGCFSARSTVAPWGTAIVTTMGTSSGESLYTPAGDLLELALDECGPLIGIPIPQPPPFVVPGLTLAPGPETTFHTKYEHDGNGDVQVELQIEKLKSVSSKAKVRIEHTSSVILAPGSSSRYGIDAFQEHDGVAIQNQSETDSVMLQLDATHPAGYSATLTLMPGQILELPPADENSCICTHGDYALTVSNIGSTEACVGVHERGYLFDVVYTNNGEITPKDFARRLEREPAAWTDTVDVTFEGIAGTVDDRVHLVVRDPDYAYTYDPCSPDWENYGAGHPGTLGVPMLRLEQYPILGTTIDVQIGNSGTSGTIGVLFAGSAQLALPSGVGGTILANPEVLLDLSIPSTGADIPWSLPFEPSLCGSHLYGQVAMFDPGASNLFSFTRGLDVRFGIIIPQ